MISAAVEGHAVPILTFAHTVSLCGKMQLLARNYAIQHSFTIHLVKVGYELRAFQENQGPPFLLIGAR